MASAFAIVALVVAGAAAHTPAPPPSNLDAESVTVSSLTALPLDAVAPTGAEHATGAQSARALADEADDAARAAKKAKALEKRKARRLAAERRAKQRKAKAAPAKANGTKSSKSAKTPTAAKTPPSTKSAKQRQEASSTRAAEPAPAQRSIVSRRPPIRYQDVAPTPLEAQLGAALVLDVSVPGPHRLWSVTLHNTGSTPISIYDDPRLLWFEVTPPGAKQAKRCELPKEMRPNYVTDAPRVRLEPGQSVTHAIEPRFYCFEAGSPTLLVAGAQVLPHYGWETNQRTVWESGKRRKLRLEQGAPYVAKAQHGDEGGLKEAVGLSHVLGEEYAAGQAPQDAASAGLRLEVSKSMDAARAADVTVEVTLENRTQFARFVAWRPEQIEFSITGAKGTFTCDADRGYRAVEQQSLVKLGPGKSSTRRVRLQEFCPTEAFDAPGLYYVKARLQTRGGRWNGDPVLAAAPDESAEATMPMVELVSQPVPLRIRHGEGRFEHWEPEPSFIAPAASTAAAPAGSP